jgi:hypothetical protein
MAGLFLFGLESGGGDDAAPVVSLVSPTAPGLLSATEPVIFTIEDETRLVAVRVDVEFAGAETWEGVYRNGAFSRLYADGSTAEVIEADKSIEFTVYRRGGWPRNWTLTVDGLDLGGNEAEGA